MALARFELRVLTSIFIYLTIMTSLTHSNGTCAHTPDLDTGPIESRISYTRSIVIARATATK